MQKGFNCNLTYHVIQDLSSVKFFVKVPAIALVSDVELEPLPTETIYKNGVRYNLLRKNKQTNEYTSTDDRRLKGNPTLSSMPGGYRDNKHIRGTEYLPQEVYISLNAIIDIYHNGFAIALTNKDDINRMATKLNEVLDELDLAVDKDKSIPVTKYIEEFYTEFIKNKKKTVTGQANNITGTLEQEVIGYGGGLLSTDMEDKRMGHIDLSDILVN